MTVTREALLAAHGRLRSQVRDARAGIHGPGSTSWEINREVVLFLGGGRAALLQLAHPYVAHAVDQHSETRHDVHGRFQRTFTNVYAMAFGDLDEALRSSRRVHNIHAKVTGEIAEDVGPYARGHHYQANDEQALLWVHATLVDTAVQVYERVVHPLSSEDKQRYLDESRMFAALFGIPDAIHWDTWDELEAYMARMFASEELTVGEPARDLGRFLMEPPTPAARPLMRWYRLMTAGLLPPRIRRQFGFRFGRRDELLFGASLEAVRRAYGVLPARLRHVPAYVEAVRRSRGQTGRDRFGRLLESLATRAIGGSYATASGDERSRCPVPHAPT